MNYVARSTFSYCRIQTSNVSKPTRNSMTRNPQPLSVHTFGICNGNSPQIHWIKETGVTRPSRVQWVRYCLYEFSDFVQGGTMTCCLITVLIRNNRTLERGSDRMMEKTEFYRPLWFVIATSGRGTGAELKTRHAAYMWVGEIQGEFLSQKL